jgi:hypothetical protein
MRFAHRICLSAVFVFMQIYLSAQDKSENYIGLKIPDSLSKNANMVCRLDEQVVEIKSVSEIISNERHIYTVLNENGNDWSTYRTVYDQFTTINSVTGTLYNAANKEIQHFKKKDMQDQAAFDGSSFVSDERIKKDEFVDHSYPYTVSFEEQDEMTDLLHIPRWYLPRTSGVSVMCSRYVLIVSKNYKIRYKLINSTITPTIVEKGDKTIYTWELKNLPGIEEEPYAITTRDYNPYLLVGPTTFEVQGYKGNMSDWNDYAKFYYNLQKGRDQLPDDIKHSVHALTDNIQEADKKVAVLYDYLQKNTHYVGIQLGIGGFQTFDAAYVAKNKYGDCKALSNFMVSILKEAGIKAYPVVIYGGKNNPKIIEDFPSHQFNHVICCVPMQKDTFWLECTSQYLSAGYLSSFTADRYGLLVSEKGGMLVHTPVYRLKDNICIKNISGVLDQEGNLHLAVNASYKAACQDHLDDFIHYNSKSEQLEKLKTQFDLPTYNISSFNYTEDNSGILPVIHESLDVSVNNYAQVTGKRIFINPDILSRSRIKFPENEDRKLDIKFSDEYHYVDSVRIEIPPGYEVEAKSKDITLDTKYGKYANRIVLASNSIVYYRSIEQYSGRYPVKEYNDVRKFYDDIYEADHTKLVLVKKN